ncbi:MAG: LptF/LptG family permease [Bauldia sp.]|nr:LptF/LptG family permease [Bauldia sp.]
MSLAQRYIFRRLLAAFLVAFPALAASIWASQALREISLVTDRGQGLWVFLEATVLLLPSLVTIIAPITVLIAVIYALNSLNADSELISLAAGGISPALLIRPILLLAIPVAILVASSSLFFGPAALRASSDLIADVNANLLTSVIQPGQFRSLDRDVTIYVGDRRPDGTLLDIFVFDQRDADQTIAYLARSGAAVEGSGRSYLRMTDGQVQRQERATGTLRVIQFAEYAFDLSALIVRAEQATVGPAERPVGYLLDPDPSDPIFVANPYRYTGELHNRITTPLYALALAFVPAMFLGTPRSNRRGRGWLITAAAAAGGVVMAVGLSLDGGLDADPAMMPLGYGLPLLATIVPIGVMASGRQVTVPSWLRIRAPGLARRRAAGP